jgi:hypothetical protein
MIFFVRSALGSVSVLSRRKYATEEKKAEDKSQEGTYLIAQIHSASSLICSRDPTNKKLFFSKFCLFPFQAGNLKLSTSRYIHC